jgi:hypothetical protein
MKRLNTQILPALPLVVAAVVLAVPRSAGAVTVTSAACVQQTNNLLRYDCTITTDDLARVWVDFCEGSGCSFDRASESSYMTTSHEVTLWNLKPNTTYDWQAHAHDRWGADTDGTYSFTTGDLTDLDGDGTTDPDLAGILFTPTYSSTETSAVEHVLLDFGCGSSAVQETDYLIIADTDGNIVWYQSIIGVTGHRGSTVGGYTVGRGVNRIHAILDKEYIVEWDLSGEQQSVMCRCDSAGLCSNGNVPDVCFDDWVHHDLVVKDDTLWAITAEEVSYSDLDDCDEDPSTKTLDFIMDGVNAWTRDGTQIVDWDVSQIYGPWTCGQENYWNMQMDGEDWAHANSLWVNSHDEWTLSLRFLNRIIHVDGDPSSTTFGELIWDLSGNLKDASDDWTVISSAGYTANFSWQHHAWWKPGGTLMVYDNQTLGPGTTRAIAIDLNEKTYTADIVGEYDLGTSCFGQGAAFDMLPSGHTVANCSDNSTTPGVVDASIYEFTGTGSTTAWEMTVSCDSSTSPPSTRIGPLYRAQPFYFEH